MGFFSKIIAGLKKTRQAIGFQIKKLFKAGVFDGEFFDELETLLLTGDVGAEATEQIIENLRGALDEQKVTDPEKATKILKEILVEMLGDEKFEFKTPAVILVTGVNGTGKTTTIGKLARLFKNQGKSVVIAAADTFRAAAGEQLEIWAERAGVRIIKHQADSDPAAVVFDAVTSAKSRGTDVLLIDTAGRLHNKTNLMEELKKINRVITREFPQADRRNVIVLDATTGQNAVKQVEVFNEAIDLDSIILTKLDGTAKGGVVLAIRGAYDIPISFVGVGEGQDDLIQFDPEAFAEGLVEE